jgi:hypothetical protein
MPMTDDQQQTLAQRAIEDFTPKLVELTDDVLFADVWERAELCKRDRSLVTVAALVAGGNTDRPGGPARARRGRRARPQRRRDAARPFGTGQRAEARRMVEVNLLGAMTARAGNAACAAASEA